jgi:hypothetical protein
VGNSPVRNGPVQEHGFGLDVEMDPEGQRLSHQLLPAAKHLSGAFLWPPRQGSKHTLMAHHDTAFP